MNCFIGSFFTPKINVNKVKMDSVDKNRSPSEKNQSSEIRLSESANKDNYCCPVKLKRA